MTAPWIGEMSAEDRVSRLMVRCRHETPGYDELEAGIADAERRARAKALEEAAALVASLVNSRHTPHDMQALAVALRALAEKQP